MTKGASGIDEGKIMRSRKARSWPPWHSRFPIAASAATAEPLAWDQEKVTAIAGELPLATRALREALRRQPSPRLG